MSLSQVSKWCLGIAFLLSSVVVTAHNFHEQLHEIAEDYFAERLELDPMEGSMTTGELKYADKLSITIAPSHIAKTRKLAERTLKKLKGMNESDLSYADQITYRVLKQQLEDQQEASRYPSHLMPMDQYGGLPVYLAQLGSGLDVQPLKTVEQYEDYIARLKRIPAWIDQAIKNMQQGLNEDVVQHRALVVTGLPAIKALTEKDAEKNPYYTAINNMPSSFPPADQERLRKQFKTLISKKLVPASAKLVNFLEQKYLPHARTHAGIDSLPNGVSWYNYLVKHHTTTAMTAAEIHQLGLNEVARIHQEMAKIQKSFGFEGTLLEFLKWQNNAAQFMPFKSEQEILDTYDSLNKKISMLLPALFGKAPKSSLKILPEPPLTRSSASDHYNPPAPDGSRPGIYYAVIEDPKTYRSAKMTSLFLHEGQPGHHFQIGLQMELSLPSFRKYGWFTAFGEGWALYAETLGREMDLYQDPNQYLGHLKLELIRAVRLVTDTGLHTKQWSREQTIQYMMNTEGSNESDARRATERYMAWPGQALAYKIGALKIQQLRQEAQVVLGDRFSLKEFHDLVLEDGVLPLSILESKVRTWVDQRRQ